MIKKPIVTNHAFFTAITFKNINSFNYINKTFRRSNPNQFQKDFHQDNLSFTCL